MIAETFRLRVRFLGTAEQWGDGGALHGWQVWRESSTFWRQPRTADEESAVRAVRDLALPHVRIAAPGFGVLAIVEDGVVRLDLDHQRPGWGP